MGRQTELLLAAAGYGRKKRRKSRAKLNLKEPLVDRNTKLQILKVTLEDVGGDKTKAAKLMGISRMTVYRWLKELSE